MRKEKQRKRKLAWGFLTGFVLWTLAVNNLDVRPIGPLGSEVGFASLNGAFHELTGVHMGLYTVTDWLGLVPLPVMMGFAVLGLVQWIGRGQLRKVDPSIRILGGFYLAVMAVYVFFEICVINYRPVLIGGRLEASYPSSTTLLVLCVMPTAIIQLKGRVQRAGVRRCLAAVTALFTAFTVLARLVSGVHWLTDIIGGILLSAGLVLLYEDAVSGLKA